MKGMVVIYRKKRIVTVRVITNTVGDNHYICIPLIFLLTGEIYFCVCDLLVVIRHLCQLVTSQKQQLRLHRPLLDMKNP